MKLTNKELATLLAALRAFQKKPSKNMEHFQHCVPLAHDEIDALCERLNCVEIKSGKKGIETRELKIAVHIEEGIVQGVYANVSKAKVNVYDTDPEYSEVQKEKRNLKRAIKGLTEVRG